jgi:integrase
MRQFGPGLGQKSLKDAVGITNADGRIRLRWRYNGKRYSLSLLPWIQLNVLQAKKTALQIEQDIITGNFDSTLVKYSGKNAAAAKTSLKSFVELFEEWTISYKQMDCEVHTNYNSCRNMIRKWGKVNQDNVLSKLNKETFCNGTYNRRLTILKSFADWLVTKSYWKQNPFQMVQRKKVKHVKLAKREPFTEIEISQILHAVKNDLFCSKASRYKHSHYYEFLYFMFKTGVRNAEAIGLRVGSINCKDNIINIKEVMARSLKNTCSTNRVRKETKNGKIRQLPFTPDLIEIITPLIKYKQPDDLVFVSPTGKSIDDHNFQNRIFKVVLKNLNIPERTLYACRHTFGSRCIDQGITPVMTAFLMGNNPQTALKSYTHQITIPKILPDI